MRTIKNLSLIFVFIISTGKPLIAQLSRIGNNPISNPGINLTANNKAEASISNLKYGLFSHYVWPGGGGAVDQNGVPSKSIQEQINTFDVKQYAKDCKSFGVQYVIFTAWHARMNPLYYSPVYRKWRDSAAKNNPDKNDKDLIAELANALKTEGIDLFLYTHPNDLHDFTPADKAKFDYKNRGDTTFNFPKWNDYLTEMYSEISKRYKGKIKGFWVDEGLENVSNDHFVDYKRLRATVEAVDPSLVLIQNYWHYGTGQGKYLCHTGMKEFQIHSKWIEGFWQYGLAANRNDGNTWPSFGYSTLGYIEENIVSKENPPVLLKARDMFRYTIYQSASNSEGLGACWCADPKRGLNTGEIWVSGVQKTLSEAGQLIKPVSRSIFGTKPSASWPAKIDVDPDKPFEKTGDLGTVTFVAMQSNDGKHEFIHVLNPSKSQISNKKLTLSAPADGKIFIGAKLVKDNTVLTFSKADDGVITISLPNGMAWDANDTAIELIVTKSK
jgi:hypothetical protein